MARRRKVTRDVGTSWQGQLVQPFADETWAKLEAALEAEIDDETRSAIGHAVVKYRETILINVAAEKSARLLGRMSKGSTKETSPLTRLEVALTNVVTAFRDADDDPEASRALIEAVSIHAEDADKHLSRSTDIDLVALRSNIEVTFYALRFKLAQLADNIEKPSRHPFDDLIVEVGRTLEQAGHRVTAHGGQYEAEPSPPSHFQKAMALLNDFTGHPYKANSPEAFYSRVAKSWHQRDP